MSEPKAEEKKEGEGKAGQAALPPSSEEDGKKYPFTPILGEHLPELLTPVDKFHCFRTEMICMRLEYLIGLQEQTNTLLRRLLKRKTVSSKASKAKTKK